MEHDIHELDEIGHRMRVCLDKAQNFISTFTLNYHEVMRALRSGKYGEDYKDGRRWMALNIGYHNSTIVKILHSFEQALANEQVEELKQQEVERRALEKQAALDKKAAEEAAKAKRRADREAAADAERKATQERIAARNREREAKALAARQAKEQQAEAKRMDKEKRALMDQKAETLARAVEEHINTKDMPEQIGKLLEKCQHIEKVGRVQLGECYNLIRDQVQMKHAGLDEDGKPWTWVKWIKKHGTRSIRDVQYCIDDYYKSKSYNAQGNGTAHLAAD